MLLVRRAVDPQRGLWTLPAGFIDAGEDPIMAVQRECLEETGLEIAVTGLIEVLYGLEHPRGAHILLVYRTEIMGGELLPGDDVDGAGLAGHGSDAVRNWQFMGCPPGVCPLSYEQSE